MWTKKVYRERDNLETIKLEVWDSIIMRSLVCHEFVFVVLAQDLHWTITSTFCSSFICQEVGRHSMVVKKMKPYNDSIQIKYFAITLRKKMSADDGFICQGKITVCTVLPNVTPFWHHNHPLVVLGCHTRWFPSNYKVWLIFSLMF